MQCGCSKSTAASSTAAEKEVKLWGGRFQESVTDAVERFTESISFDKALYKHDIMGSRAHATMLAKQVSLLCPCWFRNPDEKRPKENSDMENLVAVELDSLKVKGACKYWELPTKAYAFAEKGGILIVKFNV